MMAYIKKEPIVEFITKGLNNPDKDKAFGHDAIEILTEIECAHTAEVEEVRHGEWKLKSEIRQLLDDVDEEFYVECPICHRIEWVPYILTEEKTLEYANEHYPYCHCGAKMDGGKNGNV